MADQTLIALKKLIQQEVPIEFTIGQIQSVHAGRATVWIKGSSDAQQCMLAAQTNPQPGDWAFLMRPRQTNEWIVVIPFSQNKKLSGIPSEEDREGEIAPPSNLRIEQIVPDAITIIWDAPAEESVIFEVQSNTVADENGNETSVLTTRGSYAIINSDSTIYVRARSINNQFKFSGWTDWLEASPYTPTVSSITGLLFEDLSSDPATPSTGTAILYVKGGELYLITESDIIGPFGEASGSTTEWGYGGTSGLPGSPGSDLVGYWDNETGDVWMRNGAGDGWLGPYNLPTIGSGGSGALTEGYKLRGSGTGCGASASTKLTFSDVIYDTDGFYNAGTNTQTPSVGRWQHTAWVQLTTDDDTTALGYISVYITGEYDGELVTYLVDNVVLTPSGLPGNTYLFGFSITTIGNIDTPNEFELFVDNFSGEDATVQDSWIEGTRLGDVLATPA